jgi:hypothetical protein
MWPARVPGSEVLWPSAGDGQDDIDLTQKRCPPDGSLSYMTFRTASAAKRNLLYAPISKVSAGFFINL